MCCLTKFIKKIEWYDIGLIKIAVFFFTLMLIVAFPGFLNYVLSFDWYFYLILALIFSIPSLKKMFF